MLEGYGSLPFRGRELERRLCLYSVVFTVSSIQSEFEAGAPWPPWFDYQQEPLREALAVLS